MARGIRIKRIQDWLVGQADTSLGRLALEWFRRYFEASRNSGCALALYSALSVIPCALVAIAYFHPGSATNVYAEHLITHLRLTGSTASLVRDTFGSTSANKLAATVSVVVTFLLWGIGIGQLYRDVYAKAWRIGGGSVVADQWLFTVFFFVVSAVIALDISASARFEGASWYAFAPAWLAGSLLFWLWTPRFLLHKQVTLSALVPGALLATVVIGGTIVVSPLFLSASLNSSAKAFGAFGIVMTLVGFVFVLTTISLVCAVFSPVWAEWRQTERAAVTST